ncbi:MAG: internal scaffolding protein [Microviridae sp.]|nr:MAG: internal scaffolding protein [Microviridae sp.]
MHYKFSEWHQTNKEIKIPLTIHHHVDLHIISMDPVLIIGVSDKQEVLLDTNQGNFKITHAFEHFEELIIRGKSATQKIGFKMSDKPLHHQSHIVKEPEPEIDNTLPDERLFSLQNIQNQFQPAEIRSRFEPGGFPSAYEISDDLEDIFEEDEQFIAEYNAKHQSEELPAPQIGDSQPLNLPSEASPTTSSSQTASPSKTESAK